MNKNITWLTTIYLILVSFGMLVLLSASSSENVADSSYFVKRQVIWIIISVTLVFFTAKLDYRILNKYSILLSIISIILLVLVLIPGIGKMVNGSWRWIQIGSMTIQPSEFAKPIFIILLSWWLSRNIIRIEYFRYGILIPLLLLLLFILPILLEPDFGTTLLFFSVGIILIFISGSKIKPLFFLGTIGIFFVGILILNNPERMSRILAFLNPEAYQSGAGYQLTNSLRAFASGGLYGVGFGNSFQKFDYLPEAHTDFIFPIIGEEFGLIVSLIVIVLYISLFVIGMNIGSKAQDDFGRLLGYGITLMITTQSLINFFVVTGWAPTKGLALPFISYGGSSILSSSIMIGILLSIAIDIEQGVKFKKRHLFKDRKRKI